MRGTPPSVILCKRPACRSVLAVGTATRLAFNAGAVAVCHRVTLTCLKCGYKTGWKPSQKVSPGAGEGT